METRALNGTPTASRRPARSALAPSAASWPTVPQHLLDRVLDGLSQLSAGPRPSTTRSRA